MEKFIDTREIIWPYRFDLLIRIDFLEWFEKIGMSFLPVIDNNAPITADFFISNSEFFTRAKQHPYFIQYSKLKRKNRLRNLTCQEASTIYAEGIANFLKLKESIESNSFRAENKIALNKPLFRIGPNANKMKAKRYYIGDGCHRLACLIWIKKDYLVPSNYFKFNYKLFYNPANDNLTAGYRLLKVLNETDIKRFESIFKERRSSGFDSTLQWAEEIREKFSRANVEDIFMIKINSISFNI